MRGEQTKLDISFAPAQQILDDVINCNFASGEAFRAHCAAVGKALVRPDHLLALRACSELALYPHQLAAVRRVLNELNGRALLADEVGLGKTIEAGVILKEYLLRGQVRNALLLVPPSLLPQWGAELNGRFGIPVTEPAGADGWDAAILLVSLDTAKRPCYARRLLARAFDMVIVDEAHHLRNSATDAWRFASKLRAKYLLMLTATPVQNNLRDLYNLVTIVAPGVFNSFTSFQKEFVAGRHQPKNLPQLQDRLRQVMVRSNRREALVKLPRREVTSLTLQLGGDELTFYEQVQDLLRQAVAAGLDQKRLLTHVLLLKEAASHVTAAVQTLARMASRPTVEKRDTGVLTRLVALGRSIKESAKLDSLARHLSKAQGRTVIFTEFRATQAAIVQRLSRDGLPARAFHGSLSAEARREVLAWFAGAGGALVCTEAGGEGHNLQSSARVINFDLPWNPMRVEQRIGRVHRLGQTSPVEVVNMVTLGTIEEHVCFLLDRKIGLFEAVVGDLDAILSRTSWRSFEAGLTGLVLKARDGQELRAGVERFGEALTRAREEYENTQAWNDSVFCPVSRDEVD